MAAAAPLPRTFAILLTLAARRAVAVSSISFGQWGSAQHSQALAAQIARAAVQARQRRGSRAIPASSGDNCVQGKHLPDFYVLGAKNTATSSLWVDLISHGAVTAPGNTFWKEWHFFLHAHHLPAVVQQALWLESLPDCGAVPAMMGDFSVTNLILTPLPSDFAWSQDFGYQENSNNDPEKFEAAKLIHKFHGEALGSGPMFVVMLREPLARVQSEYYHTLPLHNCVGCMANGTFGDSFATSVALLQHQPPLMSDWFWKSFYARQIEEYLKYFDAKQFFFAPNTEYFAVDPEAFSSELLAFLSIPATPWREAYHVNAHEKPDLDEELPAGAPAREAYEAFMAPENERLIRVLAQAHTQGAVLPGFTGPPGDVAAVRDWLVHGW